MHSCLIAFIFYLFIFINTKLSLIKDLIISIPYIILIIFTLISPFTRFGIFYIDSEHIYQLGKTHALLYVNTIFYMLLAVYIIFIKGKIIRFITKLSLTCSIFLVLGLTIFQMLNPTYLLTASATVLGITVMYYVVQLLSQYLDTSTNTYNRVAFSQLLENVDNRKKPLWACLISIYSLDDVSLLQNNHIDDEIITMVGKNLNNLFVGCHVCHLYYTNYVVLSSKPLLENECLKKINKISTSPIIDNIQVQYKIGITIVNTKALETPAELINLIDYVIFHELYMNPKLTIFDETTILKYQNQLDLNVNFKKYLVSGLLKQQIKEIYTIDQELHGCQVIPWVDVSYEVSIEDLIDAARSNNCITLMIKTLIMDLKNQMDKLDKYKYISIKLPQSFILNNEVMELIKTELDLYKERICFIIEEKDCSLIPQEALEEMNKLSQLGYHNIIDNFGVGYTNSKTLLYLDLFAVCVNLQTLKLTMSEETIKKFLILVHEIIKQINTNFLCFGVTTNEDITLLKETGVDHYQTEEKHIMK